MQNETTYINCSKEYQVQNNLLSHDILKKEKGTNQIIFKTISQEWLSYRKDTVKESTYIHYRNILNKHVFPELGNYSIGSLTNDILDNFLRNKLHHGRLDNSGGLSPKTVIDIRSILILIINYAQQHNYLCQINKKIFYPRNQKKLTHVMDRKEQLLLETFLYEDIENPFHASILITLYSGLRIGEICALQWKDFNFSKGTVSINKTIYRIQMDEPASPKRTKIVIERPKTESSIRIIPLPFFILKICLKTADRNNTMY